LCYKKLEQNVLDPFRTHLSLKTMDLMLPRPHSRSLDCGMDGEVWNPTGLAELRDDIWG